MESTSFRLAVATTGNFLVMYHRYGMGTGTVAQKKELVVASLVHLITRINGD
jgi:hypothetical protein